MIIITIWYLRLYYSYFAIVSVLRFSPACAIAQEHRLNFELGPEGRASTGLQVTLVTWDCLKECASYGCLSI